MANNYMIRVENIELKDRSPSGPRYSWQMGERVELYLNITGYCEELDAMIYFNTPSIDRIITSGPGAAVVIYRNSGTGDTNQWLTIPTGYTVFSGESTPKTTDPQPLIQVGQDIVVRGSIKKIYASGLSLTRVKLVDQTMIEPKAEESIILTGPEANLHKILGAALLETALNSPAPEVTENNEINYNLTTVDGIRHALKNGRYLGGPAETKSQRKALRTKLRKLGYRLSEEKE